MPKTEIIVIEELKKEYEVLSEMNNRIHDMILRAQKTVRVKKKDLGAKKLDTKNDEDEEIDMDISTIVEMKRILITQMVINPKISIETYEEMSPKETEFLFAYLQDKIPKSEKVEDLKKKVVKR
jgi:hypothetical protein